MHSNEKPQPGTAGASAGKIPTVDSRGGESTIILPRAARGVNPLFHEQNADPVANHLELAAWHRERAARWLEFAHVSPWHASQWRRHIDAAAEHDRMAALHARRIEASTEEIERAAS